MLEPEELRRWERLTAAMLANASKDDPEAFAQVVQVLESAMDRLPQHAKRLRFGTLNPDDGQKATYSWADLGRALGVSPQGARQRFGKA